MITKATMWDKHVELTKGISCDWHEERGQMCMTVRTIDGEQDITDWSHEKLTDALESGYIKWGNADTIMEWYETHDILVEMPCIHKHQVLVDGKTVVSTYLFYMAESTFENYVEDQQKNQWEPEPVVWMYNGDIHKEYEPFRLINELATIATDACWDHNDPVIEVRVERPDGTIIKATMTLVVLNEDMFNPSITIVAKEDKAED